MSLLTELTSGRFPRSRPAFFAAHIRPDGRPWSYDGHEYLRAIIADDARDIVVRKAAQLGASTVALGRALHDAVMGRKVGYYLSDRDFMMAFVQDRLDPLINSDNDLAAATTEGKAFAGADVAARARRKSADNLRIKHVSTGTLWFQGLQKLKDAKSLDLDALVLDELNELDAEFLPWLDDRLLHSSYKRRFSLSQCGVPDFGIDAEFQASDQKFLLLRCRRCRRWCNLIEDWPDCFTPCAGREREPRIICKRCGARVTIHEGACEWVAKHPDRPVSGYALSQLYGPHCDAEEVARRVARASKSRAEMASLMVSVVGLPFAGDRQPLSDEVLSRATGTWPVGPRAVLDAEIAPPTRQRPLIVAGIDTGDVLHAVAAEQFEGKLFCFDVKVFSGPDQWAEVARWLSAHAVDFFVIDAQPYATNAKALCRDEGLHGAICYFNAPSLTVDLIEKTHAHPIKVVRADRTEAIDEMADAMIAGELLLPMARLDVTGLIKRHCKALVKDLNERTGKFAYKQNVENHFGLALTYVQLARRVCELLNIGPAEPFVASEAMFGTPLAPVKW